MISRAWALAAMTALLLSVPTSLADEGEEEGDGLLPSLSPGYLFDPSDLEDGCTSMLRATFVSFGGTIYETDIGEEEYVAYVDGEHHTHVHHITEFVRLILGPLGEELTEVIDIVEDVETIEESTIVEGVLFTEWERDLIVWERIERTVAVPLPAEGEVKYADSDVVSSCEADDHLSIEFPVYGGDYDVVWGEWYYEPYAPETPEPEWIYDHITHDFTEGVPEGVEYEEYRHGHCACPDEVAHATAEYVAGLHPVIEETIEYVEQVIVHDDDEQDAEAEDEEEPVFEEDSEQSESAVLQAFQAAPMTAKAGASGVGLAGLLGTVLFALRRK